MKSATSVIALVAAIAPFALAVPFNFERDVKYEYVTTATTVQAWVTVTPGAENVKAAEVATSSTSSHDHTHKEGGWTHSHAASSTAAPAPPATSPSAFSAPPLPSSEVPVPTPAPAPTTEAAKAAAAPAPSPSSSSSSSSSSSVTTSSEAQPAVSAASVASGTAEAWQNADVSNFDPSVPNDGGDRHLGWLRAHNDMRKIFQASPLVWDANLEQIAKDWYTQDNVTERCVMAHNSGVNPYGQNVAGGYNSPKDAVGCWVNEYKAYNFADPSKASFDGDGHFTQVVWQSATKLGCAQHNCPGLGWQTRCNYDTGNSEVPGELQANVKQNTGPVP